MTSAPLRRALVGLLLAAAGCATETTTDAPVCWLDEPAPSPASAAPGDTVTVVMGPLTETWDTLVTVGGATAEVVSVTREGCDDCDDCFTEVGIGACDACDETCGECVETLVFLVPTVAPGAAALEVVNRHGRSPAGWLEVLEAAPVDTGDTGDTAADTGDTAADTGDTAADTGDTGA